MKMLTTGSPEVQMIVRGEVRLKEPENPFYRIVPDGAWTGHRCFLVGGGRSLEGFDFSILHGEKIIAINAAFRFIPFADICFFMDYQGFWRQVTGGHMKDQRIKEHWQAFSGHKVFLDLLKRRRLNGCYNLNSDASMGTGVSRSMRNGLYHGQNAGFGALNLAICLNANPIYLLGYDMRYTEGKSHFHDLYRSQHDKTILKSFIRPFNQVAELIAKMGYRVVNLNPNSALHCFPKSTIEKVINDRVHHEQARKGVG